MVHNCEPARKPAIACRANGEMRRVQGESEMLGGKAPAGSKAFVAATVDSRDGRPCPNPQPCNEKPKTPAGFGSSRFLKEDIDKSHAGLCSFTHICVEVDLRKGLPDRINLKFGNFLHSQPFDYENTAFRCRNCRIPGHLQASCPVNKNSVKKSGSALTKGWGPLDPDFVDVATFKEDPYNASVENNAEESVECEKMEIFQDSQGIIVVSGTERGLSPAKSNSDQESLSGNQMASTNPDILPLIISSGNGKWQEVKNIKNKKGRIGNIEDYFPSQNGK
ncbi:hypothetical protein KI387_035549 [Taxus chinensis]|uniref:CCHC-type domain-containing protein n=1 Tax=Taxus chinensis TaxID=29808 RepID=A0AA38KJF3_TAXCH|nr:hypothetical protein KI387_035549 [Taxus chinensis]